MERCRPCVFFCACKIEKKTKNKQTLIIKWIVMYEMYIYIYKKNRKTIINTRFPHIYSYIYTGIAWLVWLKCIPHPSSFPLSLFLSLSHTCHFLPSWNKSTSADNPILLSTVLQIVLLRVENTFSFLVVTTVKIWIQVLISTKIGRFNFLSHLLLYNFGVCVSFFPYGIGWFKAIYLICCTFSFSFLSTLISQLNLLHSLSLSLSLSFLMSF